MTTLRYATIESTIGELFVAASDAGVVAVRLAREASKPLQTKPLQAKPARQTTPVARLLAEAPFDQFDGCVEDPKGLQPLLGKVRDVVDGRAPASEVPLDLRGTALQKQVWKTLMRVPWGATFSYTELARKAGHPRAVRAVASACAKNPITFIVPCHRILRKNGDLGGYGWGLDFKKWLLEREAT